MKYEHSYGAVIFNSKGQTLVEYMALGHVSLPKGHIEQDETPLQCAIREIKEETGLIVDVDTFFQKNIIYSPYPGITKTVTYFIASYKGDRKPVPQLIEVSKISWEEVDIAIENMTYQADKDVIKAAYSYYSAHKSSPQILY